MLRAGGVAGKLKAEGKYLLKRPYFRQHLVFRRTESGAARGPDNVDRADRRNCLVVIRSEDVLLDGFQLAQLTMLGAPREGKLANFDRAAFAKRGESGS